MENYHNLVKNIKNQEETELKSVVCIGFNWPKVAMIELNGTIGCIFYSNDIFFKRAETANL